MSSDPPSPSSDSAKAKPGKVRTWWHPLLAAVLRWLCGDAYLVREEVPVGKKPLQIDILLLRQSTGALTAEARRILAGLVEYLNERTLVELKGPTDTLRSGDFRKFLAYAHLYCSQNAPLLDPARLNLLVIAPQLTGPYREELRICGVEPHEESPGIWRLHGPVLHRMWVLETAQLADGEHPLLAVMSPALLTDRSRLIEELIGSGYQELLVYVAQQVEQFRHRGEEFIMQHMSTEEMNRILHDIVMRNREMLTPEERLEGLAAEERLKGLAAEERLKGLAAEERLKGLPPEELLKCLSRVELLTTLAPELAEQLRVCLQSLEKRGPADPKPEARGKD